MKPIVLNPMKKPKQRGGGWFCLFHMGRSGDLKEELEGGFQEETMKSRTAGVMMTPVPLFSLGARLTSFCSRCWDSQQKWARGL